LENKGTGKKGETKGKRIGNLQRSNLTNIFLTGKEGLVKAQKIIRTLLKEKRNWWLRRSRRPEEGTIIGIGTGSKFPPTNRWGGAGKKEKRGEGKRLMEQD